ncbi:hypothetical protein TURU_108922 [Turdus rufiventris]|nr:hypothetical protein TURU_108922 [Turdus rufiventris]
MEVAQADANDICKKIILGLPFEQPLTVDLIIKVCTNSASSQSLKEKEAEQRNQLLLLLQKCTNSLFGVLTGQIITQVIPMPNELPVDNSSPGIYWAEVTGEHKPWIGGQGVDSSEVKTAFISVECLT